MRVIANLNERILVALFVLLLKKVHFLAFFKNDFEENINIHVHERRTGSTFTLQIVDYLPFFFFQ